MPESQLRPWAKVSEIKEGSIVTTDESHQCMMPGVNRVVQSDSDGRLYVACAKGIHNLGSHLTHDGLNYAGFFHVQ